MQPLNYASPRAPCYSLLGSLIGSKTRRARATGHWVFQTDRAPDLRTRRTPTRNRRALCIYAYRTRCHEDQYAIIHSEDRIAIEILAQVQRAMSCCVDIVLFGTRSTESSICHTYWNRRVAILSCSESRMAGSQGRVVYRTPQPIHRRWGNGKRCTRSRATNRHLGQGRVHGRKETTICWRAFTSKWS